MRRLWLATLLLAAAAQAAEPHVLWRIGTPDHSGAEFAWAPNGYARFTDDAFFVVGRSDPKTTWPYVHPGPDDNWAGSRAHTFTILFGVKAAVTDGECRFVVDLVDSHYGHPPTLTIQLNGHSWKQATTPGVDDQAIFGDPSKGKFSQFAITFPAKLLRGGENRLDIVNDDGSWLLYDALALETPDTVESAPVNGGLRLSARPASALIARDGKLWQAVSLGINNLGEPVDATVRIGDAPPVAIKLKSGINTAEAVAPDVTAETALPCTLTANGVDTAGTVTLKPVRHWVFYLLVHSHNDIGYTDIQPHIAAKQAHNVARALELIAKTRDYPEGARFKWNLEVFWPADQFLATATPEQKAAFEQSVRDGTMGVDGMYANLLTGMCRSEELMRQFTFAAALGRRCGRPVESMMLSDVPAMTWGIVPALQQVGIKYISAGPNPGDRIGYTREQWEDKPFWWLSPSGKERVLYWNPTGGYAYGHGIDSILEGVRQAIGTLEQRKYPYDISCLRWSKGDNGSADERVPDQVRDWNARYAYPKLVIATTPEAFHALEARYGDQLPVEQGDFTPYWEDGAGSAARESALNRHSADRLSAAEALYAMLGPTHRPADDFAAAWKNVTLWSEHTWGAWCSVSQPDSALTKAQWGYKQGYSLHADEESRKLLDDALALRGAAAGANEIDVYNTCSWPRTEVVTVPAAWRMPGDLVVGEADAPQRLSDGSLAFVARDVPPFGARRYRLADVSATGPAPAPTGEATVDGTTLHTPQLTVKLDPQTGAVVSLRRAGLDVELADAKAATAINDYLYLPGGNVRDAKHNGPATVRIKEKGPLVVSLVAESDAPGCKKLTREVRLVDGSDRVEIIDTIDKERVRAVEGVHLGFGLNVPNPTVRVNSALAVTEVEKQQLPGACRNWYSVERWLDVSNDTYGVTLTSADVPEFEVGGLTANLPRSQPNPRAYLAHITPSSTLYAWVMNNHWHTNYPADQEGPVTVRFALCPHGPFDALQAARVGMETTEPLLVTKAAGPPPTGSRLTVAPDGVQAFTLKPSEDGKALIVRLMAVSGRDEQATLTWSEPQPTAMFLSDATEQPGARLDGPIAIPAWGVVTVRAELP
jgi:hypothetical protein